MSSKIITICQYWETLTKFSGSHQKFIISYNTTSVVSWRSESKLDLTRINMSHNWYSRSCRGCCYKDFKNSWSKGSPSIDVPCSVSKSVPISFINSKHKWVCNKRSNRSNQCSKFSIVYLHLDFKRNNAWASIISVIPVW